MTQSKPSRTFRGLAEILRQQDTQPESTEPTAEELKAWERFEERVKKIYSVLLNTKGDKVLVSRDVKLVGRNGSIHQFDVYYEFSRAGVSHRVAIECKDKGRPLEMSAVMTFCSKVSDIPGLQGVMVSGKGYQSGAKKYAEDNGILAIGMSELPGVGSLLAMRIENVACPDEDIVGEPFWSLYEIENGKTNGNLYAQNINGRKAVLLFYSKGLCAKFLASEDRRVQSIYAVRGMAQRHLCGFIRIADFFRSNYFLVLDVKPKNLVGLVQIQRRDLIKDYVIGEHNLPDEPMTAPGY